MKAFLLVLVICGIFCLTLHNFVFAESDDYVVLESKGEEILLPVLAVDENYVYTIIDSREVHDGKASFSYKHSPKIIRIFTHEGAFVQQIKPEIDSDYIVTPTDMDVYSGIIYISEKRSSLDGSSYVKMFNQTGTHLGSIGPYGDIEGIKINDERLFVLTDNTMNVLSLENSDLIDSFDVGTSSSKYPEREGFTISDSLLYVGSSNEQTLKVFDNENHLINKTTNGYQIFRDDDDYFTESGSMAITSDLIYFPSVATTYGERINAMGMTEYGPSGKSEWITILNKSDYSVVDIIDVPSNYGIDDFGITPEQAFDTYNLDGRRTSDYLIQEEQEEDVASYKDTVFLTSRDNIVYVLNDGKITDAFSTRIPTPTLETPRKITVSDEKIFVADNSSIKPLQVYDTLGNRLNEIIDEDISIADMKTKDNFVYVSTYDHLIKFDQNGNKKHVFEIPEDTDMQFRNISSIDINDSFLYALHDGIISIFDHNGKYVGDFSDAVTEFSIYENYASQVNNPIDVAVTNNLLAIADSETNSIHLYLIVSDNSFLFAGQIHHPEEYVDIITVWSNPISTLEDTIETKKMPIDLGEMVFYKELALAVSDLNTDKIIFYILPAEVLPSNQILEDLKDKTNFGEVTNKIIPKPIEKYEVNVYGGHCFLAAPNYDDKPFYEGRNNQVISTDSKCEDPDGEGSLPLGAKQFYDPTDLSVNGDIMYVTDTQNNRIVGFKPLLFFQKEPDPIDEATSNSNTIKQKKSEPEIHPPIPVPIDSTIVLTIEPDKILRKINFPSKHQSAIEKLMNPINIKPESQLNIDDLHQDVDPKNQFEDNLKLSMITGLVFAVVLSIISVRIWKQKQKITQKH